MTYALALVKKVMERFIKGGGFHHLSNYQLL
jgi:hypothetical protein